MTTKMKSYFVCRVMLHLLLNCESIKRLDGEEIVHNATPHYDVSRSGFLF